jgi:CxxC motif-containing protein (DUF1111 family)
MNSSNKFFFRLTFWAFLLVSGCQVPAPEEDEELSGGKEGTVFNKSADAFGQPFIHLTHEEIRQFQIGNSLNRNNWVAAPASTTARDGLGPLFNASACASCHARDGRGIPFNSSGQPTQSILFRLSVRDEAGNVVPEPTYGGQLQHQVISGAVAEGKVSITYEELPGTYPDGTRYSLRKPSYSILEPGYGDLHPNTLLSPRMAPHMAGIGLLDAVDEATILANADPDDRDRDGISGRPNYVWDIRKKSKSLGRFGWKANEPSAEQQVAGAFVNDIGITSSIFPQEAHSETQQKKLSHFPSGGEPELEDEQLAQVVFYIKTLAIPARRNWRSKEIQKGKKLFQEAGCTSCHVPQLTTGKSASPTYLANQVIRPYTDLLLHDMGEGLSDNRPDGDATGSEWRTAPLWGIGLQNIVNKHTFFLHDGRARNLEEAILWHGGEAENAKDKFKKLKKTDRDHLIQFVESL